MFSKFYGINWNVLIPDYLEQKTVPNAPCNPENMKKSVSWFIPGSVKERRRQS